MSEKAFFGIIFDLDGTLVDSLPGIAKAMNLVLESYDRPIHPETAYRDFIGAGLEETVRRSAAAAGLCHDISELVTRYRLKYDEIWPDCSIPYKGIKESLQCLASRSIPMAVLSNKHHYFTEAIVRFFFPDIVFGVIRGSQDGLPAKPDPAAALETALQMGLDAHEAILVGDSDIDLETASRAGMSAALAAWGYGKPGLSEHYPESFLLKEPADIMRLFS